MTVVQAQTVQKQTVQKQTVQKQTVQKQTVQTQTVQTQTGHKQVVENNAGENQVVRGQAVHGQAVHGQAVHGQAVHGQAWGWGRRRVLLLNATYEPLTAVSVRRAVVLLIRERADIVAADDAGAAVHSAAMSVPLPTVIRLRTYVRVPYRAVVPMTRAALMHRDGHRCGYCSAKATTIDHIVPRSRGGGHSWENCVACCTRCNHRKADRLLGELGWVLRTTPTAPKGRHAILLSTIKDVDPAWAAYIDAGAA